MAAFIFTVTVLFFLLLIELVFASFGIMLPLSLIGLHYLAFTKELPLWFPLTLGFGFMIDTIYGREIPCTLIILGIFVLLMRYNIPFNRLSVLHQTFLAGLLTGSIIFTNLLPGISAVHFDWNTLFTLFSLTAFAVVINMLLTPFLFSLFDLIAVGLGVKRTFDPRTGRSQENF